MAAGTRSVLHRHNGEISHMPADSIVSGEPVGLDASGRFGARAFNPLGLRGEGRSFRLQFLALARDSPRLLVEVPPGGRQGVLELFRALHPFERFVFEPSDRRTQRFHFMQERAIGLVGLDLELLLLLPEKGDAGRLDVALDLFHRQRLALPSGLCPSERLLTVAHARPNPLLTRRKIGQIAADLRETAIVLLKAQQPFHQATCGRRWHLVGHLFQTSGAANLCQT